MYITVGLINTGAFGISLVIMILATMILLAMSAFISGSEVAFFSLSPSLLKELENEQTRNSESILRLLSTPRELLATILISNNFINVAIILLSSLVLQDLFEPTAVTMFSITIGGSLMIFLINVVLVTFLLLLVGEVVPKVFATSYPLALLKITAIPLEVLNSFLVTVKITPLLLKSTAIFDKHSKLNAHNVTMDDLQHALELTSKKELETEDHKILEGVVKFGNTDVKQIMTPRVKAVFVDMSSSLAEVIALIKETRFSRIPVYEESIDVVKGVLFAKDLLPHLDKERMDWNTLIRAAIFVPENKKIDDLLTEFQAVKMHMAIVVDEYGGVSGLVTLEDVIEEIVGDISGEFDEDDLTYSKLSDTCFVFEGQTSLNNMYRVLGVDGVDFEEEKGEADSVAGFVLEIAGRIPLKGESLKFKQYTLTIESADRRRIKSVKVDIHEA